MYIDSHSHYNLCFEKGIDEIDLMNYIKENMLYSVHVSTEAKDFEWAKTFSKKYKNILYSAGLHPASDYKESDLICLSSFIEQSINEGDKLFGIGETGLDYHWMEHSKEKQITLFEYQIQLAKKYDLPVIVHNRDAHEDTINVIKNSGYSKFIIHCFSGDKDIAKQFLDLGTYISFAGNLTFKKAENLHESVKYVPEDRLLMETDCPYLTPVPFRGKINRPDYVRYVYDFAADCRNVDIEEFKSQIAINFKTVCPVKIEV